MLLRLEHGEDQVLQFPKVGVQSEPPRERDEKFQRGPGDPLAFLPLRVEPQGAHVVHPVSELDDQHAQVNGRGHDHLAERLGLRVVAPPRAVELGDAVDQHRHLRAELRLHLPDQQVGVLDRVVQQGRRQRGGVHPDRGQQLRDGQRMRDVGRAGLARLAPVIVLGHLEGTQEQADVGAREDPPVLSDQWPDGGGHPGQARGRGDVVDQAVGARTKRSGPGRHRSPVNPCSLVVSEAIRLRGLACAFGELVGLRLLNEASH